MRHMLAVKWGRRGEHTTAERVLIEIADPVPLDAPHELVLGRDVKAFGLAFALIGDILTQVQQDPAAPKVALYLPAELATMVFKSGCCAFPAPKPMALAIGVVPTANPSSSSSQGLAAVPAVGGRAGCVEFSFSAEVILTCLKLHSMMRPSASMADVVKTALRAVLPPDQSADIAGKIERKQIRLPVYDSLRRWAVRLDCMVMLWQRVEKRRHNHLRCILIDSSPIGGWNYMCSRSSEFKFPAFDDEDAYTTYRLTADLNACMTSRRLPVMVLGHGASTIHTKLAEVIHMVKLECETEDEYNRWRYSVRHYCSDQGSERILERCPNAGGFIADIGQAIDKVLGI